MRIWSVLFILTSLAAVAQFDPAGGELGSKSISNSDESIIGWASSAQISRGFRQIDSPSLGKAEIGQDQDAVGPMDGKVVSLGDGGEAILQFESPISDGEGYDFAVFENGFQVGLSYYLELAHVEVSSDGINYVRFPSESLTDTSYQINNFSYLDPESIYNLAGKHQGPYGTLFDLREIGMDQVTHVKLIDVVGSIDSFGSRDSKGRIINDPWPSPFESSGFDLDAVAVVDGSLLSEGRISVKSQYMAYPNITSPYQIIHSKFPENTRLIVTDTRGRQILETTKSSFYLEQAGIYYLTAESKNQRYVQKILIR